MVVYIINGHVTRNNIDDRPYHGYFVIYASTTVFIIYWNPDQPFVVHTACHVWFDEYYSRLSIEYIHTTDYLLLRKYPESILHN